MSTFFTVCIPSTNRGKTIYNTLASLSKQVFKNFDVRIVDCKSGDNTVEEINRFFESSLFLNDPFKYEFVVKDYIPQTVEDWNEPVRIASGKYIAMLEGDDQFLPEHLAVAHNFLINNPTIGIYATGNTQRRLNQQGYLCADKYQTFIYSLKEVPPPSQTIFIRLNKDNAPFYYNTSEFVYAPEIELYLTIAAAGFNAYHGDSNTVYRSPSSGKTRDEWVYYHDHFLILKKYNKPFSLGKMWLRWIKEIQLIAHCSQLYATTASKDFKKDVKKNIGTFSLSIFLAIRFFYRWLIKPIRNHS